ncbi:MAG: hypothetical protein KDA75_15375, partial [Planctomycetaceae bacterium]|nr:hypothetical protein [Planctomycetaceae bacterium]
MSGTLSAPPSARISGSVSPEDRAVHLYALLHGVSRLQMLQAGARTTLVGIAVLIAFALAAVFTDAVFDLSPGLRIAVLGLAAAGVIVAGGLVVRELFRHRFRAEQAARQVECHLKVPNSLLINAVEFASTSSQADSPVLRDRTVRMAEEQARNLSSFEVVRFAPLGRALGWAALATIVAGLCGLLVPRLFGMVLPRYLDPYGDHPPYTLVTFDVSISPEPVYHGRPASITAVLGGPESVERAEIVFPGAPRESGTPAEPRRLPMFRRESSTFVLEIAHADESQPFYIDTPNGRSETQTLSVVEVPFFEETTVRYEYPEYTGWTAHEQPLDGRGARAIAGTQVVITASSNLPLAEGRLELLSAAEAQDSGTAEVIRLTPVAGRPRTVQGRFHLIQDGQFQLSLTATSGGESLEPLSGTLSAIPDKPPRVAIVEPQPHVIVVENWSVPVAVEAVDDVGIGSLRLSRSVNGWGPSTIDLPYQTHRSGAVRGEVVFDLQELGARAGDVITYYATAADTHPAPRHFADSPTCVIQVISEEDYTQFARQQYQLDELTAEFEAIQEQLEELQRQREAALEELQSLQEHLASDPENPELQERMAAAEEQLQKYAEQSEHLAQDLRERAEQAQLYDLEQPYTEALEKLADDVQQQSIAAAEVADALQRLQKEGATPENQQALREATERLAQQQDGLDDAAREQRQQMQQDLETLRAADHMLAQAERLKSIIQQQRGLATRLGEFQNQSNLSSEQQQRADQLAREQDLLEQELQEVARELESAAESSRAELPQMCESARQIAQAIRDNEIPLDQQQAASQARQGSGRSAHQRAESAAEKLEALAGQCPSCQGAAAGMCSGGDGPLSLSQESLQRSLEQLAQGRGLPGLPRPGQPNGQGQRSGGSGGGTSGQSGSPQGGAGDLSRWRPGQSFPGSQSRTPILGPRMVVEQQQPQPGGQLGGNERGSFLPGVSRDPLGDAELLTPESREFGSSAAGSLRGVPVPYRPDAEAYFRRLADD